MNNGNFIFFFRFFPFSFFFSETPGVGGFTSGRECGMFTAERGYQSVKVVSRLPAARKGFQHQLPTPQQGTGKTGRGDDMEGCRLVTAAGGS